MRKNTIKNILDLLRILLLISAIMVLKLTDTFIICLIPIVVLIILSIIERIFWRCTKCKGYLPIKSWFNIVVCCPYCGADIEENKMKG